VMTDSSRNDATQLVAMKIKSLLLAILALLAVTSVADADNQQRLPPHIPRRAGPRDRVRRR
jgi:hypothetical protein